ncbi:SSI family serine proteinase inhibitor [Streptomyces sp. NPDC087440]|uniref:SSI family serine proteinase inhibitor n=1 Tax=Streptomyces sp. NPDC087440 TaxID=3365790 RepID=UPI0037FB76F7
MLPLLAVLGAGVPAAQAADGDGAVDRLTVTVGASGYMTHDGTWELTCHPAGGNHPWPQPACDHLDGMPGDDPFAPVPADAVCTDQYGGPAVGRISGTWKGRPVEAVYSRVNGCEMGRWDGMVPVLLHTEGAQMPLAYRDLPDSRPELFAPALPLSPEATPGLAPTPPSS